MARTFTCALCGGEFPDDAEADAAADAEARAIWGVSPEGRDDFVSLCGACWEVADPRKHPDLWMQSLEGLDGGPDPRGN